MSTIEGQKLRIDAQEGNRLIPSKFPPISLFEDVADEQEFEALYELQALTNPRLLNEAGNLNLLPRSDIPFGIRGCSVAVAPFTHINPEGSRFSDGSFGVLYLAQDMETALAEVRFHQSAYWAGVEGLNYDRLVLRGFKGTFGPSELHDTRDLGQTHPVHSPENYAHAREMGVQLRESDVEGVAYLSARNPGATCWGLFSPRNVTAMVQTMHYELIWNGSEISSVNRIDYA